MSDALKQLQETLAVDGYAMSVQTRGERTLVTLSAGDGICGDCLVPKPIMKSFLEAALDQPESHIDLLYPDEVPATGQQTLGGAR